MVREILSAVGVGLTGMLSEVFGEVLLEIFVKGLGFVICRRFYRKIDPDGWVVTFVGITTWAVIGLVIFFLFRFGR